MKLSRSNKSIQSRNKQIESKTTATTTAKIKPKVIKENLSKPVLKSSAII